MRGTLKLTVTETQLAKLRGNADRSHLPIRLYVKVDHLGRGGYEMASVVANPFHEAASDDDDEMEGEGLKKLGKKLKKAANKAAPILEKKARIEADVARTLAPALVASGDPQLAAVGMGLQTGANVTDALLPPKGAAKPTGTTQATGAPTSSANQTVTDTTALILQLLMQLQQQQQPQQQQGQGRQVKRAGRYSVAKKKP